MVADPNYAIYVAHCAAWGRGDSTAAISSAELRIEVRRDAEPRGFLFISLPVGIGKGTEMLIIIALSVRNKAKRIDF
jgi:hypothetical protein